MYIGKIRQKPKEIEQFNKEKESNKAFYLANTGMDDSKEDSNKNIDTDEEITSKSVELSMDVALPESVFEATFKTKKHQLIIYEHLEDTISKYGNEKDRMLMILTYNLESGLQGTTIKNLDEFNKAEDFDSFIRKHFHSENKNIFMMDDLDDDLNDKKADKSNDNNNSNNNNNNNNKSHLGAVKTHTSDVKVNDDSDMMNHI